MSLYYQPYQQKAIEKYCGATRAGLSGALVSSSEGVTKPGRQARNSQPSQLQLRDRLPGSIPSTRNPLFIFSSTCIFIFYLNSILFHFFLPLCVLDGEFSSFILAVDEQ